MTADRRPFIDPDRPIPFALAVAALGPELRAKRRPLPDGPSTVAFRPAVEPTTRPVAPSVPMTRPGPAPTPRGRPTARRIESRDLTMLRVALNQLLEEEMTLADLCHDACAVADGIRAEWKRSPKSARPELRKRLKLADAEVCRLGELVGELETRMDAARDAIDRSGRVAKKRRG
jgi:hypothetical protein